MGYGMYDAHILTDEGCRSIWEDGKKVGYCVNLKINYYRGLPLCCIDEITLEVDREKVAPETMFIQHNGREYGYLDLLKIICQQIFIGYLVKSFVLL